MIWSQVFRALSWITELCCNKMCEQHTGFCKQGIEGKINLLNSAPNNNFPQYTNDLDPWRYFVLYSHKMLFLQKFEFLEDGMEISAAWLLNYYISAAMNSHYHYINVKNVTLQNQIFCFFFKHHQVFQEKKKEKADGNHWSKRKKKSNNWFLPTKTGTAVHQCPKKKILLLNTWNSFCLCWWRCL